jgi:subtilisin family serine protease
MTIGARTFKTWAGRPRTGRRRRAVVLVAVAAAMSGVASAMGVLPSAAGTEPKLLGLGAPNAAKGRYLVQLRPSEVGRRAVSASAHLLTARYGGTVRHVYRSRPGFAVDLSEDRARRLATDPAVDFVHADVIGSTTDTMIQGPPNPSTPSWGLDRIDTRTRVYDNSYSYVSNGAGVHVYVIDTGIRTTHADFFGRASHGWDFVQGNADASDCTGHGTHVAGTAAGAAKHSVAKIAEVVSLRAINCNGNYLTTDVIAAVDWVTSNAIKPAVVNMSLGGLVICEPYAPVTCVLDEWFEGAVNDSIDSGVVYAVSAGNDGFSACGKTPAKFPRVITVASTASTDTRPTSSNYGSCVDIFAPGEGITSLDFNSDTGTTTMSGTSMASPHVAGMAAVILGAYPDASPEWVTQAILSDATRDVVNDPRPDTPNRLLHSWTGIDGFGCERRPQRFWCDFYYYDLGDLRPVDEAETIHWYRKIDNEPEAHVAAWDGRTSIRAACIAGKTYQFRIELTHASGLSGSTARHAYGCALQPPNT